MPSFDTLKLRPAIDAQLESVVLVSTDKAVRPTNVMGATKRIAELIAQALSLSQGAELDEGRPLGPVISMVRFGNVLSSSGSVIPRFQAQIRAGGPLTVTHPEITRYFMTIPEAVGSTTLTQMWRSESVPSQVEMQVLHEAKKTHS